MGNAKYTEMRTNECEFTKRVYESTVEGRGVRERPKQTEWKSIGEGEWVGEVWNALRGSA